MKSVDRIRLLDTNQHRVRCYAVSRRLTLAAKNGEHVYYLDEVSDLENGPDDFVSSKKVATAIAELLQVNGIFWVLVRPFEICIKLESAFEWNDVNEDVVRIIQSNVFDGSKVEVQDCTGR